MKTPESDLKDKVKKFLSGVSGCWFFMPVPTGYGVRGIPDFIGCYRGKFFGIETKAVRYKETPWQKIIREKITAAGGVSIVAYQIEEIWELIDALQRETQRSRL